MNLFGHKHESKHSEDKSAPTAVLESAARTPRSDPVNHPVTSPMKPSMNSEALAPSSAKSSPIVEGSAPSSLKPSLISEGFEFTGDMKSDGSLTVDGAIKGNLIVQALLIRATGLVDGSVKADSINVEGCLSGAIECKDLVVGSHAVVDGQLIYNTVTIQRGGTVKGDLKRG